MVGQGVEHTARSAAARSETPAAACSRGAAAAGGPAGAAGPVPSITSNNHDARHHLPAPDRAVPQPFPRRRTSGRSPASGPPGPTDGAGRPASENLRSVDAIIAVACKTGTGRHLGGRPGWRKFLSGRQLTLRSTIAGVLTASRPAHAGARKLFTIRMPRSVVNRTATPDLAAQTRAFYDRGFAPEASCRVGAHRVCLRHFLLRARWRPTGGTLTEHGPLKRPGPPSPARRRTDCGPPANAA